MSHQKPEQCAKPQTLLQQGKAKQDGHPPALLADSRAFHRNLIMAYVLKNRET